MMVNKFLQFCLVFSVALIQFDIFASEIKFEINHEAASANDVLTNSFEKPFRSFVEKAFEHFNEMKFSYICPLKGGTESTFKFTDLSGEEWVLKYWKDKELGISEFLGLMFISGLSGANSLGNQYFVGNTLPESIKNSLKEYPEELKRISQGAFFSIVPFISGKEGVPSKEQLEELFILTCFFSYFDAKDHNTIIDAHGNAHIIDAGSSLLYRGMGERKKISNDWHPYYISEFQTMFNFKNMYTEGGLKSLDDINVNTKIASLKSLLDKGQMILLKADAFLRWARSSDRIATLEMLSNRLYQIEIYYNHLSSQWNRSSRKYIQASDLDGAGFLTVARDGEKPVILLGKRKTSNGYNTWCNLGGAANELENLDKTAVREVFEESSGKINVHSAASLPSHDLVLEKKPGVYSRYRTYFHPTKWFDVKSWKNEEYSQFAWVPIEDILQGSVESKGIELFEPFQNSLKQPEVRQWLELFVKNKPVLESHTQGLNERLATTLLHYNFDSMNPSVQMAECTHEFIKSLPSKINTHNNSLLEGSSISRTFLNELAKSLAKEKSDLASIPNPEELETSVLFDKVYKYHSLNKFSDIKHAVLKSIEEEKKHPNHYVMYHGLRSDLWLIYRTLSYIRFSLNGDTDLQTKVLRSLERFFDVLNSAEAVRNALKTDANTDDESPMALATTLSCNPTLFSNYKVAEEETLSFLAKSHNVNPPKHPYSILTSLFSDLGITDIRDLYTQLGEIKQDLNGSGALLQFFIPKNYGHIFYLSEAYGVPASHKDKRIIEDNKEGMSNLYDCNEEYFSKSYSRIQTRLHLNIANVEGLEVFDYFADGSIRRKKIDRKIADAVDPILESLGLHSIRNTSAYREPTLLQNITRGLVGLSSEDMLPEISESEKAVLSLDLIALKKLCINNPDSLKELNVILPGRLEKIHVTSPVLKALTTIDDDYLKEASGDVDKFIDFIDILEERIDVYNYANEIMPSSHRKEGLIRQYILNKEKRISGKSGMNFVYFYAVDNVHAYFLAEVLEYFNSIQGKVEEENIAKIIEICEKNELTGKQKYAILAASTCENIDVSKNLDNLLKFVDCFLSSEVEIWEKRDLLFNIFISCDTLDQAKELVKYWDSGYSDYGIYNNFIEKDFHSQINNIKRLFGEISKRKTDWPLDLVVDLAYEIDLYGGSKPKEEELLRLVESCPDDNYNLLKQMLLKKITGEYELTVEIVLQAYKNNLTLEQCELALAIIDKLSLRKVESVVKMCSGFVLTTEALESFHQMLERRLPLKRNELPNFWKKLINKATELGIQVNEPLSI
jgi:hypothetical protein